MRTTNATPHIREKGDHYLRLSERSPALTRKPGYEICVVFASLESFSTDDEHDYEYEYQFSLFSQLYS